MDFLLDDSDDYDSDTTSIMTTFSDQSHCLVPADFIIVSSAHVQEIGDDTAIITPARSLPDTKGISSGSMTNAFIESFSSSNVPKTAKQTMFDLHRKFETMGLSTIPQITSSRLLDVRNAFFQLSKGYGVKRAVLVGINYIGQKGQLSGCHNDVKNMKTYIETVHKFEPNNIEVLMDDGMNTKPTRENLFRALSKLVQESKEGDSVFFHFSGHGGILLPEKNIYKNKNNQFDETLIPLDHEMRGPIRDFNLFHHFVHPMSKGVTVTCIIDSCHSGSILDLPYRFRSNSTSVEMEEDEDTMSNLAFMFTAGGLVLPDMFDGRVKENIEHATGQKLEDLHGIHTDELKYDNYSSSSSSTEAILTAQNVHVDDIYDDNIMVGTGIPSVSATTVQNVNGRDLGNNQQSQNNEYVRNDDNDDGCCCCCGGGGGGGDNNAQQNRTVYVNAANLPQRQAMQRYEDDDDDDLVMLVAPLLLSDY